MPLHQPALAVAVTFPGPGTTDKQAVQASWKRRGGLGEEEEETVVSTGKTNWFL